MPDIIHVRVSEDGDIYCKDDPHRMKLKHHPDKKLAWHSNKIEFVIAFKNGSPFDSGEIELISTNKMTDPKVVKAPPTEDEDLYYVYEVSKQSSAGQPLKADPGLIIQA